MESNNRTHHRHRRNSWDTSSIATTPSTTRKDGTWHKYEGSKEIPFTPYRPYIEEETPSEVGHRSNRGKSSKERAERKIQAPISTASTPTEKSKKGSKKRHWKDITKDVAREVNYAINYNGQKDISAKKINGKAPHIATRIAAIAIPFIHFLVPETKIITSTFTGIYQVAQYCDIAHKDPKKKKVTVKDVIESPLTRTMLTIGVVIAGFFASRVALIVLSSLKLGLDIMDLRNEILKNGFGKQAVLIMIKVAGSVAYLALCIFDSNLALAFTIAVRVSSSIFTCYCEAKQGRLIQAFAALAFGAVSNYDSVSEVVESAQNGTILDLDEVDLTPQKQNGATDLSKVYTKKKEVVLLSSPAKRRKTRHEEDEESTPTITIPTDLREESFTDTERLSRDNSHLDDVARTDNSRRRRRSDHKSYRSTRSTLRRKTRHAL